MVGGGCSGFSYSMAFENSASMLDKTYSFGDLKVFIDQAGLSSWMASKSTTSKRWRRRLQVQQSEREEHLRVWHSFSA